jgi:hypothetical protein
LGRIRKEEEEEEEEEEVVVTWSKLCQHFLETKGKNRLSCNSTEIRTGYKS